MGPSDVRTATRSDLPGMAACHLASFPDRPMSRMGTDWLEYLYATYLEAAQGASLVALDGERVVGLAVGGDRGILRSFRKSCIRRFPIRLAWKTLVDPVVRRPVTTAIRSRLTGSRSSAPGAIDDDPARGSLLSICVLDSARGSGTATALLRAFESRCETLGFESLQLSVLADNPRARGFYEREGWELQPGGNASVRYRRVLATDRTA